MGGRNVRSIIKLSGRCSHNNNDKFPWLFYLVNLCKHNRFQWLMSDSTYTWHQSVFSKFRDRFQILHLILRKLEQNSLIRSDIWTRSLANQKIPESCIFFVVTNSYYITLPHAHTYTHTQTDIDTQIHAKRRKTCKIGMSLEGLEIRDVQTHN